MGSEPEVEKTFHDDIDTGSDFADVARTIGAILLGGYIGRKAGKKLGSKLSQLSEAVGNVKKTADYQQATTWPQQKQLAEKQPTSGGRWAGDEVRTVGDSRAKDRAKKITEAFRRKKELSEKSVAGDVGEAVGSAVGRTAGEAVGKKFSKQEKSALSKLMKAVEGLKEGLIDGGDIGKPYTDSSKNITEKKNLIPEDYEPPEAFMTKQDCECNETTTGATNITFSNGTN